jgi:hypothetical protein
MHGSSELPFAIAAILVPDNIHLAPNLKIELGIGFHILPKWHLAPEITPSNDPQLEPCQCHLRMEMC